MILKWNLPEKKYLTPFYIVCVHVRGGDVSVFEIKRKIAEISQQQCYMHLYRDWLSMMLMMMTIGVFSDKDMNIV